MLKYIVAILLLANILLFGWMQGWLGDKPKQQGREPNRIESQVRPTSVQILESHPTDQTNTAEQPPIENTQTDVAVSESPLFFCIEAGPLNGKQSSQLQEVVKEIMPAELWEMDVHTTASSWVVYVGGFTTDEQAQARKKELDQQKIDTAIVRGKPDYQPGITLGLFGDQANADRYLRQVQKKGVTDATIVPWTLITTGQLLRVKEASEEQKEMLEALTSHIDAPSFQRCSSKD